MRGILVTSNNCDPCALFKEQFKDQIESGEIEVKSLEDNEEEVLALMQQYGADIPSLLILSNAGEVIINSSP